MEERPREVHLSKKVDAVCQTHAMSSEKEEIMGMLVGYLDDGCLVITDCIQLPRNDKRPDRVEIAPEQLAEAAQQVEAMKPWWPKALPEPRLVGWYHSHPHITVLPSAVDIATQKVFEQMSTTWVGLIYAVFNRDARRVSDRYQLIAFMSNVNYEEQMTTALSKQYSSDRSEEEACGEIKDFALLPISYSCERHKWIEWSVGGRLRHLPSVIKCEARQSLEQTGDTTVRSTSTLHDAHVYGQFITEHARVNALPLVKRINSKRKKDIVAIC